jgi:hypothetical protein
MEVPYDTCAGFLVEPEPAPSLADDASETGSTAADASDDPFRMSSPFVESDFDQYEYEDVLSLASHDSWDDDLHAEAAHYVNIAVMCARSSVEQGLRASTSLIPEFEDTDVMEEDELETLRLQARQTLLMGLASGRLAEALSEASEALSVEAERKQQELQRLRLQWAQSIGPKYKKVMDQQRREELECLRSQWKHSIGPKYRKVMEQEQQEETQKMRDLVQSTLSKASADGRLISALRELNEEKEQRCEMEALREQARDTLLQAASGGRLRAVLEDIVGRRAEEEAQFEDDLDRAADVVDTHDGSAVAGLAFGCLCEALDAAITQEAINRDISVVDEELAAMSLAEAAATDTSVVDEELAKLDEVFTGESSACHTDTSQSAAATAASLDAVADNVPGGSRQLQSSKSRRRIIGAVAEQSSWPPKWNVAPAPMSTQGGAYDYVGSALAASSAMPRRSPWADQVKQNAPSAMMMDLGVETYSRPPSRLAALGGGVVAGRAYRAEGLGESLSRSESAGALKVMKNNGKNPSTQAAAAGSLAWSQRMSRKSRSLASLSVPSVVF